MRRLLTHAVIVTLLGALAIFGAQWAGHNLELSPPLLIYGKTGTGILAHEQRLESSALIFPIADFTDSNFYWSADRRRLLQIHLDTNSPTEENAFVLTLYPDWYAEPIALDGRFNGYSTPRWSPDGQTLIVPACRQMGTGCGFYDFYRIDVNQLQLEPMGFPEVATLPEEWYWYDNETIIIWRERDLLLLNLNHGETQTLVEDMPIQGRTVRWADDMTRMSYFMNDGNNYCLHVVMIVTGETHEVVCGGLNTNNPVGWLDDDRILYYIYGDGQEEIRLYDSELGVNQSATDPTTYLDWAFDSVFSLPETPYLAHYASFRVHQLMWINTQTRQIEHTIDFNLGQLTEEDISVAPDGKQIAVVANGRLSIVTIDGVEWMNTEVCCTVVWD